jgi:hypothetical protein
MCILRSCGKVQTSGDGSNKCKSHSWRNQEQIKFGGCLLPWHSASFVFPSKIYISVFIFVTLYKGTEGTEGIIWTWETRSNRVEKTGWWRASYVHLNASLNIIGMIKQGRMWWVLHVANMAEMRNVYTILAENPWSKWTICETKA